MSLRSDTSFNKSSRVHWSTPRRRSRVPAGRQQRNIVKSTLQKLFASKERRAIYNEAIARRDADIAKEFGGPVLPTYWNYTKIKKIVGEHAVYTRPPMQTVPFELVKYMCQTIHLLKKEANKRKLILKKNDACIVFGLAQLFDVGFSPGGVTAIRSVPCISSHGLSPCQYPKLPDLRARQQTIAVRQIQRICVDDTGRAALQLPPFVLSKTVQESIEPRH